MGRIPGNLFLERFVPRYGEHYGGGLYAQCGCFNSRNPLWNPPEDFAGRFRVFVHATTGDFLHSHSVDAYGYYRYTVGLETASDLVGEGGHCARGEVAAADALNWLVHGTGLDEEPEYVHLERVSTMDFAVGFASDPDGALWIARQPPGWEARLWRSIDRGNSFHPVSRIGVPISDLDAVGDALVATHQDPDAAAHGLYRSTDGGATFEPVGVNGTVYAGGTVADRHGRVFLAARSDGQSDVYASGDVGDSWTSLGSAHPQKVVNTGPLVNEGASDFLFTGHAYSVAQVGSTEGGDWRVVSKTPAGERISNMAWDGNRFWALAGGPRIPYTSVDHGLNWVAETRPLGAADWWAGTRLNALDHEQILILGSTKDGYLRDGQGDWSRIYGSGSLKDFDTFDHRVA
ncbi:MAG: hypothetical protein OXQ29_23455, partial [Rhodospirillaceae bacterium]|nr:hypothetical protein [Rhodospirillaceae bacterium]